MLFVLAAFLDPLLERLDLFRRELAMRIGGRHFFIRVIGGDAIDEFALVRVPGTMARAPPFNFRARIRLAIQPQLRLARGAVRPVALIAVIGKNGPDVAIETQRRGGDRGGKQDENDGRKAHWI